MASTIDKLYAKYAGRVQRYMEDDLYYQYLLELISGGKTTILQHNRVLDKTVDETWLTAIETALPAIHEIIARPRRFLKISENLVPVEQAKKINADSVRHLAAHTQYISGIQGGMIYPGKVLTVENDESIDLYENRFVATLIKKVSEFIEKRTGAIFWSTGDEEQSILKLESSLEDDYEEIEYHLEMVVKNKQTYMENDNSKMEIFKRIDRVRRVMSDFRASTFMQVMNSAPAVRSPIQRTNQITKNPHYRACYDLWQFLERYDQVGYQIDVRETALDFDEDYLFQMYGSMAMTYTVFKSLLEHDPRRITEPPKRRKTVKPKFVKQIVEQFVDDYDIPDVEIRQVIIEEVTKAQAEIERRTREKEAEREKAKALKDKQKAKEKALRDREREKEKLAAQKEKEKAKLAAQKAKEKEKAKLAAQKAKEKEKAKLAAQKAKEKEKAKLAAQKAKEKEKAKENGKGKPAGEKKPSAPRKPRPPRPEPAAAAAPVAEAAVSPAPEPVSIPEPELITEPAPAPIPEPAPEPVFEPASEPAVISELESAPEPEAVEPVRLPDVPPPPEAPAAADLKNWIRKMRNR